MTTEPIDPSRYHCPDGPPGSTHRLIVRKGERGCTFCGRAEAVLIKALTPP